MPAEARQLQPRAAESRQRRGVPRPPCHDFPPALAAGPGLAKSRYASANNACAAAKPGALATARRKWAAAALTCLRVPPASSRAANKT